MLKKKLFKREYLILVLIVIVAFFLRAYRLEERFEFAHDGDLYSWIVKDIVENKHIRLVGQITSTEGIYIGPFFYYLLVPFFLLTNMDPIGAALMGALVGVITIFSYFYVFRKLFDLNTGLVAAFLQAVIPFRVSYDRWVVPTNLVNLWGIWYLFVVIQLSRGNFWVLPIAGILVGLIWHIHLALAPLVILIPIAIYFSKKLPKISEIIKGVFAFIVVSIPLIIFEIRHNFLQVRGFIASFSEEGTDVYGVSKLDDVLVQGLGKNIYIPIIFLGIVLFLYKKKRINYKEVSLLLIWVFSLLGFFIFSNKLISEYYFEIIRTIYLAVAILFVSFIFSISKLLRFLVVAVLIAIFLYSLNITLSAPDTINGYLQRKSVANYIADDAKNKSFPCVAVSYLSERGEGVGYRYFFHLKNLHVNTPNSGSPIYSIVFPNYLAQDSVKMSYGGIGIIPPQDATDEAQLKKSCSGLNSNLTDPFFGYTE